MNAAVRHLADGFARVASRQIDSPNSTASWPARRNGSASSGSEPGYKIWPTPASASGSEDARQASAAARMSRSCLLT